MQLMFDSIDLTMKLVLDVTKAKFTKLHCKLSTIKMIETVFKTIEVLALTSLEFYLAQKQKSRCRSRFFTRVFTRNFHFNIFFNLYRVQADIFLLEKRTDVRKILIIQNKTTFFKYFFIQNKTTFFKYFFKYRCIFYSNYYHRVFWVDMLPCIYRPAFPNRHSSE